MSSEGRDAALLLDMLAWAEEALAFVADLNEAGFTASRLHQAAVIRNIEVVGEAAGHVSRDFRALHPEIPWQQIVSMRHKLIHDYGRIAADIVWQVARDDLPLLVEQLRGLVPPEETA